MSIIKKYTGGPLAGSTLAKKEGIEKMTAAELKPMLMEELGFNREYNLFKKKIEAASNPQKYIDDRKGLQEALANHISNFLIEYSKTLRSAGYTIDETGMIARHVAKQLGDIMSIPIDVEYPTEFVRKSVEDLLKKRYK